jgi:hypothetical protein
MTILFDASVPVNSNAAFGLGIYPSPSSVVLRTVHPTTIRRFVPTEADWAWLREDNARCEQEAENARFEMIANESAALDRLERGIAL